jgi:glycogen synthase
MGCGTVFVPGVVHPQSKTKAVEKETMKILFFSHVFHPNVGGIETVSLLLACEFTRAGHQVKLITQTPATELKREFSFEVFRRVSPVQLLKATAWADVVFQNNISLQTAWPLLFIRRPWVVAHHVWIPRKGGWRGVKGRLKHWLLRWAHGIAVSQAIASDFPTPCTVLPNPYDDTIFRSLPNVLRDIDLVFLGRLVPTKGVDLLIQALVYLKEQRGLIPDLIIIGGGPEEVPLKRLVHDFGIDRQVHFEGVKCGAELAVILNRSQIMVVPSLSKEPFGEVVLEGIACGCAVVGSEDGGLKDAIGLCGCTFPNRDVKALTACLARLLTCPDLVGGFRNRAGVQLVRHRPKTAARRYLKVIENAAQR